jgi:trk system potassium uptake protein TrkA
MKIVILGAGTVGTSIADMLCRDRHSVTVVDSQAARVRAINERLDVRAVTGNAAQSSILFQAGVLDCDLCLAVTGSDEVNMVAASIAKGMGSRRTVARVFAPVYRDLSTFDYQRHFRIDRMLSLEQLSAMELARAIRHSGAVAVEHFARGELEVQELVVEEGTRAVRRPLAELRLPRGVRIGSVARNGSTRIAVASDQLQPGERITLIGTQEEIDEVRDWFQRESPPRHRVVIAGGGETGYHLARSLEGRRFSVVLMDSNRERCDFLAAHLKHTTVVHADATQRAVLEEERVGNADFFASCTGDDEDNILAGVEARELGAKSILAIVSRPDYGQIVGKLGIDHVVSPRVVMAKEIRGLLNTGPVVSRMPLAGAGGISVVELEVRPGVPATQGTLAQLPLPDQSLIAAVIHETYVRVPGGEDHISPGDAVIALVADSAFDELVKLFNGD